MTKGEIIEIKNTWHGDDFEPWINENKWNELQGFDQWIKMNLKHNYSVVDMEVRKRNHLLYGVLYKCRATLKIL
jgi:hypothetical protein